VAAGNYTFLPWARRRLAARVGRVDAGTAGAALPAHAKVSVGLTLSAIGPSRYDVAAYGPGDVLGIDSKLIIHTDPRAQSRPAGPRLARNYLQQIADLVRTSGIYDAILGSPIRLTRHVIHNVEACTVRPNWGGAL
jgi:hypothetical protein